MGCAYCIIKLSIQKLSVQDILLWSWLIFQVILFEYSYLIAKAIGVNNDIKLKVYLCIYTAPNKFDNIPVSFQGPLGLENLGVQTVQQMR